MTIVDQKPKTLRKQIVSGSVVLLSGSGLTTALSLIYNLAVARSLGPLGFGHVTALYTLLTLLSAITLSFQIVTAKVVAQQSSAGDKAAAYRIFHRAAWICGLAVAAVLLATRGAVASYLNLPSPNLVSLLAIGTAFYVPLGSRRGLIQGTHGFHRLAINLVLEGAVRMVGSLIMIGLGTGVPGVVAANSAAIAIAYFGGGSRSLARRITGPARVPYAAREMAHALVFFSGQVLINNCDIVLVKHYFPARAAGLYAVVAMVGRVIFSFSTAVVNTTFPLVAGTRRRPEGPASHRNFAHPRRGCRFRHRSHAVHCSGAALDHISGDGLLSGRSLESLLSAGHLCAHHNRLLAQRGHHHF